MHTTQRKHKGPAALDLYTHMYELYILFPRGDLKVILDIFIINTFIIFVADTGYSLLEEWIKMREQLWVPPTNSFNTSGQTDGVTVSAISILEMQIFPYLIFQYLSLNYPLLDGMSFGMYVI